MCTLSKLLEAVINDGACALKSTLTNDISSEPLDTLKLIELKPARRTWLYSDIASGNDDRRRVVIWQQCQHSWRAQRSKFTFDHGPVSSHHGSHTTSGSRIMR